MARIREWIHEFLTRHAARYGPNDWPLVDTEEWVEFVRTWITAFNVKEVSYDEADVASVRLGATPPNFRREHIPAVVAMVEALRAERGRAGAGDALTSREAAEMASAGCDDCGGRTGLTIRWHPAPDRSRKVPPTVTGYCRCALGRWIKRAHAQHHPEFGRLHVDVADEDTRRVWWLPDPPAGYTLGGYRYEDEPQRVYYTPRVAAPEPPARPVEAIVASAAMPAGEAPPIGREAINAMFAPGDGDDGPFTSEASTADAQPF